MLGTLVTLSLANLHSSAKLSLTAAVFPKGDAVVTLHKVGTFETELVFKSRFWEFTKSRVQAQNADCKREGPRSRHLGKAKRNTICSSKIRIGKYRKSTYDYFYNLDWLTLKSSQICTNGIAHNLIRIYSHTNLPLHWAAVWR